MQRRKCKRCGQKYFPKVFQQLYCQDPCTSKNNLSIEERNNLWPSLKKPPRRNKHRKPILNCHYEY